MSRSMMPNASVSISVLVKVPMNYEQDVDGNDSL